MSSRIHQRPGSPLYEHIVAFSVKILLYLLHICYPIDFSVYLELAQQHQKKLAPHVFSFFARNI